MAELPLEFVIVAEAAADTRIARELADRVMVAEGPDWLDAHLLTTMRRWCGFEQGEGFTSWKAIKHLARRPGMPRYLGFTKRGEPGNIDSAQARKAVELAVLLGEDRPIRALLLIRDMDKQPERRGGMEQARAEVNRDILEVVLGAANPKREAWVLNGFEPESAKETARLADLRKELGFNPCERAEQLTASTSQAPRNAKRVLDRLTEGDHEREQRCWRQAPLERLRHRGELTGLRDYLDEVRERLLPLLA